MQSPTHAGWVGIDVKIYQPSSQSTQITAANQSPNTSFDSLTQAIRTAHRLGLKVFLRPILVIGPHAQRTGSLQYSTQSEQARWFENYADTWVPYARLAQTDRVNMLCICH
jgi:hypothetical protein